MQVDMRAGSSAGRVARPCRHCHRCRARPRATSAGGPRRHDGPLRYSHQPARSPPCTGGAPRARREREPAGGRGGGYGTHCRATTAYTVAPARAGHWSLLIWDLLRSPPRVERLLSKETCLHGAAVFHVVGVPCAHAAPSLSDESNDALVELVHGLVAAVAEVCHRALWTVRAVLGKKEGRDAKSL